jgi:phospholipase C
MRWTAAMFSLSVLWAATLAYAREPHFQHIVIIVQENRTPDNLFQGLCSPPFGSASSCAAKVEHERDDAHQYEIQTRDWLDKTSPSGTTQPQPVHLANLYDLSHAHVAFVAMCNASQQRQDDADRGSNVCQMNCSSPHTHRVRT